MPLRAVALANSPAVLVADEPTGELDTTTEESVLGLLVSIVADCAVLVATHSEAVASTANRVIALHDGRVVT